MVYWLNDEENVPEASVVLDDVDDVGDEAGYETYVHTALLIRSGQQSARLTTTSVSTGCVEKKSR